MGFEAEVETGRFVVGAVNGAKAHHLRFIRGEDDPVPVASTHKLAGKIGDQGDRPITE